MAVSAKRLDTIELPDEMISGEILALLEKKARRGEPPGPAHGRAPSHVWSQDFIPYRH